jgi:hypothetical protein
LRGFGLTVVFSVGSLALGQVSANTAKVPEISLIATTVSRAVKAGSPVVVEVKTTNVLNKGILVDPHGLTVKVWRKDDGAVERMALEPRSTKPASDVVAVYSAVLVDLDARQTMTDKIAIDKLYDMSTPGKYEMQVEREGVKSNMVTVNILP